jgi:signal peptidase I
MSYHGIARTAREVFLTLGAVLGVVCIVVTAAGFAFGVKPLIFRSGSMSPAVHTGDMAISRTVEASTLERGDIVSVVNSGGERVTHRLVNAARQGDARQLTLKGDANKKADTEVYTVTRAERVLFTIPKAGYVVNAVTSPVGVFVLGLYVAWMVALIVRRPGRGRPDEPGTSDRRRGGGARRRDRSSTKSRSAARSAVAAASVGLLTVASPAAAAWTDPVAVTGTTLTAYTVPAPATFTCGGLGVLSVTFNWAAVTGATDYTLHYGAGGATTKTVAGTSTSITAAISGGTAWVVANRNFGSTTWHSVASNTRSYTVAVVSLCN